MTLLIRTLTPELALLASDTFIYGHDGTLSLRPDGTPWAVSKLLVLPHAGCVVAVRGTRELLRFVWVNSHLWTDIDDVMRELPGMLPAAGSALQLASPERHLYPGDEVYVVGWSDKLSRMVCAQYFTKDGFATFTTAVEKGSGSVRFAPPVSDEERRNVRAPLTPADALDLARKQVAHSRASGSVVPYGGRLSVAVLTKDSITLTDAGDLGLPALPSRAAPALEGAEAGLCIADGAITEVKVGDDEENSASAFSSSSLVFYRADIAYSPLTTVGSIVSRGASVSVSLTVTGSVAIDDTSVQSASMILELWVNGVNTGVDMRNDAVAMTQKGVSIYTGAANSRGSFTLSADAVVKYAAATTINVQARLKSAFVNSAGTAVSLPSNPSPDPAKMYLLCRGSLSLTENKV